MKIENVEQWSESDEIVSKLQNQNRILKSTCNVLKTC